jgi:hypothetical protein
MESHTRPYFSLLQILIYCLQNIVQVLSFVVVDHRFNFKVDLVRVLPVEVVEVIRLRDLIFYLLADHQSRLVRPAPCYILNGVTAASQQNHRRRKAPHEGEKLTMPLDGEVEMAELITRKGVCAALDDHDIGHVE